GEDMTHLAADANGQLVETPIDETGNTMACRFYHGFARRSPCEAKLQEWVVRFQMPGFNGKLVTLKNRRFVATLGESPSSPEMRGTTDDFGAVRLPVIGEQTRMRVKLDAGPEPDPRANAPQGGDDAADESRFLVVDLDGGHLEIRDTDNDIGLKQRLFNLGFGERAPADWTKDEFDRALLAFRTRRDLAQASDDELRQRIVSDHDLSDLPPSPDDDAAPAPTAADA
ncbi:MAG: hypothetical protein KGL43_03430, partial [Burkholderiales bacterium]|nr:hypothetical protein [Burkholderiales bacterium]